MVEEEPVLAALAADLERRFSGDFRIHAERDPELALQALERLAERSVPVALVIAGDSVAAIGGVELLAGARSFHPGAKRILLVDRDYAPTNPVVRAMMLGQIDYHLSKPWRRERTLYPAVSDFLADWAASQEPHSGGVFRIVGPRKGQRPHEIRELLGLTGMPYVTHSEDSEEGRRLLAESGEDGSRLPVVIRYDGQVLVDPERAEMLEALGMRTRPGAESCDVAVLGAGPAGLAAGVYAASEGLETVVLEPNATGGQAGTSALIRNYLGFAHGISGLDFAVGACEQAWLFGADLVLAQAAIGLEARGSDRIVRITDGSEIAAKAVVIATGVAWRRLGVPSLEALVGSGVFYGAAGSEARAMAGEDVFVIGAGNSAGQAALHLAKHAASVTILVRGDSLARSMSEYLIAAIGESPNIQIRLNTEVVDGEGSEHLEGLVLSDRQSGNTETAVAAALFVMIGAEPHTGWLPPSVARDDGGYVLTGRDLLSPEAGSTAAGRPLERPPLLLECSVPGVFAAGDVRSRSVKRVASAVGEGATAVQMLHEYFRERDESRAARAVV